MLTKWVLPVIIPLSYIRERDGNITTSITIILPVIPIDAAIKRLQKANKIIGDSKEWMLLSK